LISTSKTQTKGEKKRASDILGPSEGKKERGRK